MPLEKNTTDKNKKEQSEDLEQRIKNVQTFEDLRELLLLHKHRGTDTQRLSYNDLLNQPTLTTNALYVSFKYGENISKGDAVRVVNVFGESQVLKASASSSSYADSFIGFATEDGSTGDTKQIQISGTVNLFSGLSIGSIYYLGDTAGTIQTSQGTYYKPVGIATSSTELLILANNKPREGIVGIKTGYFYVFSSGTQSFTIGFYPKIILFFANGVYSNTFTTSQGSAIGTADADNVYTYVQSGTYTGISPQQGAGTGYCFYITEPDNNYGLYGKVTTFSTTSTVTITQGSSGGINTYVHWVALK